jgi:hypothetical protein
VRRIGFRKQALRALCHFKKLRFKISVFAYFVKIKLIPLHAEEREPACGEFKAAATPHRIRTRIEFCQEGSGMKTDYFWPHCI